MIGDLRELASPATIRTGVCIIGAGAAGITMALALDEAGIDCCLVESGGEAFEADTQALYTLRHSGIADPAECRLRYLGGSTNHWGGLCAPLEPSDLAARDWIGAPAWPIAFEALRAYYPRAQSLCGLGDDGVDLYTLAGRDAETGDPRFDPTRITTRLYQFAPAPLSFAQRYRERLAQSRRITVWLHANLTRLVTDADAAVIRSVEVRSLNDRRADIEAPLFVLACGGIENARLLLLADQTAANGIGNDSDRVGRYFMQHPHALDIGVAVTDPATIERRFRRHDRDGKTLQVSLGPSAEAQRAQAIANCSGTLHAPLEPEGGPAALRAIWDSARRGEVVDGLGDKLLTVFGDIDGIVGRVAEGPRHARITLRAEQVPDPDSRIVLTAERDALGQRLARQHWRLGELDRRTLRVSALLIAQEFGRLGLGRVRLPLWLVDDDTDWPAELWGGCHHMGTTRMSRHPSDGVVDQDCRVHTTKNLYVAGSSVFPSVGYANPTLTIVALTLRLAEHLGRRMGAEAPADS